MKKFYQQAEAGTAPGGFVVRLDGKMVKTPLKNNLILPSQDHAQAIADEWQSQGVEIVPATMPITQLTNTMIDKAAGADRAAMNAEIVKYASSDLLCYFATHPADLVARQEEKWNPLLSWMQEKQGVELHRVQGIRYLEQPAESLKKISRIVADLTPAGFTVVQDVTGVTGSAIVALAFLEGRVDASAAYDCVTVDEQYQLEKWGEDDIARKRLNRIKSELEAVERFMKLAKGA